jgi:transglutaminase-like putative cysteine protease
MKSPYFILCIAIFIRTTGISQTPAEFKERYPNSNLVVSAINIDIKIWYDKKKGIQLTNQQFEERVFLNEKARLYNEGKIALSFHHNLLSFEAKTQIPYKDKFKTLKVTSVDTLNNYSNDIFHDDLKILRFYYGGLEQGVKTHLTYKIQENEIRFSGLEYLGDYSPIHKGYVRITVEKGIEINFQETNFKGYNIRYERKELKKAVEHTWYQSEIPKYTEIEYALSFKCVMPILTYQVAKYVSDTGIVQVIPDLKNLYQWYYSNALTTINKDEDSLKALVTSLVQDQPTDIEKAKRIFQWVQHNIKYVAFEDGMHGIIPREAGRVYNRRYGDCKDMSCITRKMLEYAGIEAKIAWVGTRTLPYKYTDVPSPYVDNHMICVLPYNDSIYFLDATDNKIPFGVPTVGIQGKQVLIEESKTDYKITEAPIQHYTYSGTIDSCWLNIKDAVLLGKCKSTYKGYTASNIRHELENPDKEDRKDYIKNLTSRGNNKYKLIDYEIAGLNNLGEPLVLSYTFELADYVHALNNEKYINLNLGKRMKNTEFKISSFLYDFDGPYAFETKEVNILKLDNQYFIENLPQNAVFDTTDYGFSSEYTVNKKDNSITLSQKSIVGYTYFSKNRFEEWNEYVKKVSKEYNNAILLKINDK